MKKSFDVWLSESHFVQNFPLPRNEISCMFLYIPMPQKGIVIRLNRPFSLI
jgi:hypothetical protein